MKRIHKSTMLKQARNVGTWKGYIAPCNVNAFHVASGWHIGAYITIVMHDNKPYVQSNYDSTLFKLKDYIDNYVYYNCMAELGTSVRFWIE